MTVLIHPTARRARVGRRAPDRPSGLGYWAADLPREAKSTRVYVSLAHLGFLLAWRFGYDPVGDAILAKSFDAIAPFGGPDIDAMMVGDVRC